MGLYQPDILKADPAMLRERLIDRKLSTGCTKEKSESFVDFSDMANVTVCLDKSKKADLELILSEDTGYSLVRFPADYGYLYTQTD